MTKIRRRAQGETSDLTRNGDQISAEIAELVASGQLSFPNDLGVADAARLAAQVRQLRRDRLVRHIARLIAADLDASRARSAR